MKLEETDKTSGIEFDPGFGPHVLAFSGTMAYLYQDISRFNNLSQKRVKFMQYHKKMLEVLYNNIGFYTGCLMWASYIKSLPEQELISNTCYGGVYNEDENTYETRYISKFIELFPRDMKYFLNKPFEFDPEIPKLVSVYEEFLILNKGFTETKTNKDVLLPDSVISGNSEEFKKLIDNALSDGDISVLSKNISLIIK